MERNDDGELKLSQEEMEDLVSSVEDRIDASGETRVQMSLGAMSMEIDAEASLEETEAAVERLWSNRVAEMKEADAATTSELREQDTISLF